MVSCACIIPALCPAHRSYPVSTSFIAKTTTTNTFDPIYRPTPRPITKSHDESRLYYQQHSEQEVKREDPRKLGIFKAKAEEREEQKMERPHAAYWRDEL